MVEPSGITPRFSLVSKASTTKIGRRNGFFVIIRKGILVVDYDNLGSDW